MRNWDDDERAEFDLAVEMAWRAGRNSHERGAEFLRIVRDAEQAQRRWATEVIDSALRDGMWKRLKEHHKAIAPLLVAFAARTYSMSRIGGVARQTASGTTFEQLAFIDMTREELLAKQDEYETTAFAARRDKYLISRLIALLDQEPTALTPSDAATRLGIDIEEYLAVPA